MRLGLIHIQGTLRHGCQRLWERWRSRSNCSLDTFGSLTIETVSSGKRSFHRSLYTSQNEGSSVKGSILRRTRAAPSKNPYFTQRGVLNQRIHISHNEESSIKESILQKTRGTPSKNLYFTERGELHQSIHTSQNGESSIKASILHRTAKAPSKHPYFTERGKLHQSIHTSQNG
jgi:hypothetical protein